MSFSEYKDTISQGDTVILFLGHSSMQSLVISAGKVHQTKYGAFPHSDMIGKTFGTKMFSKNNKGWIYLLHPTPELWTVNLPHRTQILYSTDISMVIMQLGIKPGSVIIESGTGSASMSHSIIRSIAPTGHLHTFEFHDERAKCARSGCKIMLPVESDHSSDVVNNNLQFLAHGYLTCDWKEFKNHNIDHLVTVTHRDVLKDGFQMDSVADADLPSPWEAIETSKQALKKEGGRICSFSPCIEQVQKTCETMRSLNFKDIQVIECLVRTFEVRTTAFQAPDFGSKTNHKFSRADHTIGSETRKRTHKEAMLEDNTNVSSEVEHSPLKGSGAKYNKLATDSKESNSAKTDTDPGTGLVRNVLALQTQKTDRHNILTARPVRESPGHTGFLTFASLYPQNNNVSK